MAPYIVKPNKCLTLIPLQHAKPADLNTKYQDKKTTRWSLANPAGADHPIPYGFLNILVILELKPKLNNGGDSKIGNKEDFVTAQERGEVGPKHRPESQGDQRCKCKCYEVGYMGAARNRHRKLDTNITFSS